MHRACLVIVLAGTAAYAQPIAPSSPQAAPVISPSTDVPTLETRGVTTPKPAPVTPGPRVTVPPPTPPPPSTVTEPPRTSQLTRGQREDEVEDSLAMVWFATDSAEVPAARREALGRAVRWLNTHPDRLLYIEGHA